MDDSIMNDSMMNMLGELSPQNLEVLVKLQEEEYIKQNESNSEWQNKFYELKQLKLKLFAMKNISPEELKVLRQFAISKGGFLKHSLRKDLWKIILSVDNKDKNANYELVYINEERADEFEDLFVVKEEPCDVKIENKFHNIIDVDVKRSKINMLFKKDGGYHDTNLSLKKILKKFINTLATLNNQKYQYYQGYHDIGLHFLLLYINDFNVGVSVFQRFSEFFLKENLIQHEDNHQKGFNFERINQILSDIIKELDTTVMDHIDKFCYGKPSFVISWILTFFTHNVMNSAVIYRLFDYFITSHPLTIYYLTAVIAIDEIRKLTKGETNLEHLSVDMDSIDYDYYIMKCEEAMQRVDSSVIMKKYVEEYQFKEYFPMVMNETYTEKLIEKKYLKSKSVFSNWWIFVSAIGVAALALTGFKKN